jgi:hypothetical protein
MVLLDNEKAYHTKWPNCLLYKLISLHLPDYLLFFLLERSYLKVHLNDSTSNPKPTPSSLPPGAALSITLFSLYLSDMPHPPYTHLTLYADNTVLLSQSWCGDTISCRLSHTVQTYSNTFTTWKFQLHTHKN